MKFYVVFRGRNPGVYDNWLDCNREINGYKNNLHKSYNTRAEAEHFFKVYMLQHGGASNPQFASAHTIEPPLGNQAAPAADARVDGEFKKPLGNQAAPASDARVDGEFKKMISTKDIVVALLAFAFVVQSFLMWHK